MFQEKYPVGYTYPLVETCPPINGSVPSYGVCDLGNSPVYTINATTAEDVAVGIKFAKDNNVRLVVKNTGHDATRRLVKDPRVVPNTHANHVDIA